MKRYPAELIGRFILVFAGTVAFVVNAISSGATTHPRVPAVFGLAVTSVIYTTGTVSGASTNPARSPGPALSGGNFQVLWIYLIAPVGGAFLAVLGCRCIREPGCCARNV